MNKKHSPKSKLFAVLNMRNDLVYNETMRKHSMNARINSKIVIQIFARRHRRLGEGKCVRHTANGKSMVVYLS